MATFSLLSFALHQRYKELLTHVSSVTRNESSDSVNGILDTVSVSEDLRMVSHDMHVGESGGGGVRRFNGSAGRYVWVVSGHSRIVGQEASIF